MPDSASKKPHVSQAKTGVEFDEEGIEFDEECVEYDSASKTPHLSQAKMGIGFDEKGIEHDKKGVVYDKQSVGFDKQGVGFDEQGIAYDAEYPPTYGNAMAGKPRIFEKCSKGRQTLTCVRTASRTPTRRADTDQCNGHHSLDINALVCRHESLFFKQVCGHRRCAKCTITWEATKKGAVTGLKKTYPVGAYPGARAMRQQLKAQPVVLPVLGRLEPA